ncbi:MAG: hypothetical protein IPG42_05735 [Betaproteobacteria bacterium]|jgi:hypothetical protein|nr:hypothetical protein [Betaproteobacteria bacterium]MBK7654299.1 hypothetical protein [Betaproteobacteria bacterium]
MNPIATVKTRLIEAIQETTADLHRFGSMEKHEKQGVPVDDRLKQVPIENVTQLRGFLHGIDTTIVRDADRE